MKIVVTGPFAAGKTTLIRTISEITVLSTERGITDGSRERKTDTTVAMDFGRITIDRELVLYLFGTPGQERFDFMWEILGEGMLGYVMLLDAGQDDPYSDAARILAAFRTIAHVPCVVAVNRRPVLAPGDEDRVRAGLGVGADVPVLGCDARDRDSVKEVLLALLYAVLEDIEAAAARC